MHPENNDGDEAAPTTGVEAQPKVRKRTRPKTCKIVRKKRTQRPYPASSLEDAMELADQIQKVAAGEKVRRLTLCQKMDKSPTSSAVKQLITNSSKYGVTTGSYAADWLELTAEGKIASAPDSSPTDRLKARFNLAVEGVPPFKALYEEYKGKRLPSREVIGDFLSNSFSDIDVRECIDTFVVNANFLGILQTIAGSEMILPIEQVLEGLIGEDTQALSSTFSPNNQPTARPSSPEKTDWAATCFYIAPIGDEGSEARRHSDLFLSSIVEPALKDFGLSVVRADKIGESGMITAQVLEHILRCKLVIVDLSLHNPNVFYELAVRHATKLPIVQVIRKSDKMPFDVDQMRTIEIDTTDIYTLVPKIETYRSEIATHVRHSLANVGSVTNPLTVFCPGFQVIFPKADQ